MVINVAMTAGLLVLGPVASEAIDVLVVHNVNGWTFYPSGAGKQRHSNIAEALGLAPKSREQSGRNAERPVAALHPELLAERFVRLIEADGTKARRDGSCCHE